MRHTKILATLGPATESLNQIEDLVKAGADAFRLNFSHGDKDWHKAVFQRIRTVAVASGRAIAIVQDLQGPKIRIGEVEGGEIELVSSSSLILTTTSVLGTADRISTPYQEITSDVSPDDTILIDEGRICLKVGKVRGRDIFCTIERGGTLASKKGLYIPGKTSSIPSFTAKDQDDADFGLALGVDFIALSFVSKADDILRLKSWIQHRGKSVPIIAKIETALAIQNLDEIVSASDGVMVARGDLGMEVPLEMIPFYQKKIIEMANAQCKIVITATQMLESMILNDRPTRAELTDIANSILDGTDVMMLSGETAIGKFPTETVAQMASVAEATEMNLFDFKGRRDYSARENPLTLPLVMASLLGEAARNLLPKAIAVVTRTGRTAALVSAERPLAPIYAFTFKPVLFHQLALLWGVVPISILDDGRPFNLVRELATILDKMKVVEANDLIVFFLGSNCSPSGSASIRISCTKDELKEGSAQGY